MSAGKLGKQLKRELTRNPKKTAALGLLFGVAIYFWAPLVLKWTVGEESSAATANSSAGQPDIVVIATPAANSGATTSTEDASPGEALPWDQIIKWIEQDKRTQSAKFVAGVRNPFAPSAEELQRLQQKVIESEHQAREQEQQATTQPEEFTPATLGMVLTGTLVGPRIRAATIDGWTYRENEWVPVSGGATATSPRRITDPSEAVTENTLPHTTSAGTSETERAEEIQFLLKGIYADYVILERNESEFTLELPKTFSDARILTLRKRSSSGGQ